MNPKQERYETCTFRYNIVSDIAEYHRQRDRKQSGSKGRWPIKGQQPLRMTADFNKNVIQRQ